MHRSRPAGQPPSFSLLADRHVLEAGDLASATLTVAEAENDVRRTLAEMRNVAHGIHPVVLTQSGLAALES